MSRKMTKEIDSSPARENIERDVMSLLMTTELARASAQVAKGAAVRWSRCGDERAHQTFDMAPRRSDRRRRDAHALWPIAQSYSPATCAGPRTCRLCTRR